MMASEGQTAEKTEITIYSLPASQYVAKVLTALDARKIPHYSVFVPVSMKKRKQQLPSDSTLVPQMKVEGGGGAPKIITDSEAILHWFDDHGYEPKLFPDDAASDLSTRASDGILAGAVWHFNWADPAGYKRTVRQKLTEALPSLLPAKGFLVNLLLRKTKKKFRKAAGRALAVEEGDLADRAKIVGILVEELKYFQSFLKEAEQPYLLGNESTAADFSVYAQVERLVGDMGDCHFPCSVPDLKDETPELARFWKWHDGMRVNHPIQYKGKGLPEE